MSTQPPPSAKVAIVVRTKNRPLLLARALDSILGQTYQHYVVIIVNDAGDRGAVEEAVARVADRADDRVHVVHNEETLGRWATMNAGLHASASTYVVVHDDDDSWAPTFLERTVEFLERTELRGVGTRTEVIFERIDGENIITESRELLAADKSAITLLDIIVRNFAPPISFLYRRDVHQTTGEYDESLPVLGDWDFLLKFLSTYEAGFIDGPPLAFWHQRRADGGDHGNSVIAGRDDHTRWDVLIRDRFLRKDLAAHEGLGYLLFLSEVLDRDRKSAQNRGDHLAGALHDTRSAVTEVHSAVTEVRSAVSEVRELQSNLANAVQYLYDTQNELIDQLKEYNRNLVGQSNRMVAQFERLGEQIEHLEQVVAAQSVAKRRR